MITIKSKLCFVIGPIGSRNSPDRVHADMLLTKIIKPTFARYFREFRIERADHITIPGLIDSQVITRLIEAELIIADITGRNANAFYELGIRHMLQKPVIHLYRRGDSIPADIAPYRAVEFDYSANADIREAKKILRNTVIEAIRPGFIVENPVTRSAGFVRMRVPEPKLRRQNTKRANLSRFGSPTSPLLDAPGLCWRKQGDIYTAVWMPDPEVVRRGYPHNGYVLWSGPKKELTTISEIFVRDRANGLEGEMQAWNSVIR